MSSGATTSNQSGLGSNGNEKVLRIPQSSSITGDSPSDYLVLYTGPSLGEGFLADLAVSFGFMAYHLEVPVV